MDYQPLTNHSTAEYIVRSWLQGKPVMLKSKYARDNKWAQKDAFDGKRITFNFEDYYYRVVE